MIADKETTYKPTRTLPTISFCLIPFDIGILMTFQRSSNLYRSPYRTDSSCLDIMRIPVSYLRAILFAYFLSKRVRNLSGCQKSACELLNNLLMLIFLLYCEYHRGHIFRSTIDRRGTSSYLNVRGVVSTNLLI